MPKTKKERPLKNGPPPCATGLHQVQGKHRQFCRKSRGKRGTTLAYVGPSGMPYRRKVFTNKHKPETPVKRKPGVHYRGMKIPFSK